MGALNRKKFPVYYRRYLVLVSLSPPHLPRWVNHSQERKVGEAERKEGARAFTSWRRTGATFAVWEETAAARWPSAQPTGQKWSISPPPPRRRGRQHFSCGSAGSVRVQSCASATGPFLFFSPVSPPLAAPGQPGKEGSWCARFWVPMLGISGTTWTKCLSKNRYNYQLDFNPQTLVV